MPPSACSAGCARRSVFSARTVSSSESLRPVCEATFGRSLSASIGRYRSSGRAAENPALVAQLHCIGVRDPVRSYPPSLDLSPCM